MPGIEKAADEPENSTPAQKRARQAISTEEPAEGNRVDHPQDATTQPHSSEEPAEGKDTA